jgi:hypothetical protein
MTGTCSLCSLAWCCPCHLSTRSVKTRFSLAWEPACRAVPCDAGGGIRRMRRAAVGASAQAAIRLNGISVAVKGLCAHLRTIPFAALGIGWGIPPGAALGKPLLAVNSVARPDGAGTPPCGHREGLCCLGSYGGVPWGYPNHFPVKGTTGFNPRGSARGKLARAKAFWRGHGSGIVPVASLSATPGHRVSGRGNRYAGGKPAAGG